MTGHIAMGAIHSLLILKLRLVHFFLGLLAIILFMKALKRSIHCQQHPGQHYCHPLLVCHVSLFHETCLSIHFIALDMNTSSNKSTIFCLRYIAITHACSHDMPNIDDCFANKYTKKGLHEWANSVNLPIHNI